MNQKSKENVKRITTIGMLCAVSFVAKLVSSVIPAVSGFLSFDLKDVIIVIAGFMMGPMAAGIVTLIVSLIEMFTLSSTGLIGLIMNILSSCAFACPAALLYQKQRSLKGAIAGLGCGVVLMTAVMLLWNWLITPLYMHVDRSVVTGMLVPVFLPFNLVKGGINAALTMLIYKPVVTALRRAHLLEENEGSSGHKTKAGVAAVSAVLFVTFVLLALVLAKVI